MTKAAKRKRRREDNKRRKYFNGEIVSLTLNQLMANPDFQRITGVDGNVKKILARGIDRYSIGVPVVMQLPDDPLMFHLVDGQCRIKALSIVYPDGVDENGDEIIIACLLIPGRPEESGERFLRYNDSKTSALREKFRIGYNSGLDDHVFVRDTLEHHDIRVPLIGGSEAEGVTLCPYSFLGVYQLPTVDDKGFHLLCRTITQTFSGAGGQLVEKSALRSEFIKALGLAIDDYEGDLQEFCKYLSQCGLSAAEIAKEASDCYYRAENRHGRKRIQCLKEEIEYAVAAGQDWAESGS